MPTPPGQPLDPCLLPLDLLPRRPGHVRIPKQLSLPRSHPALPPDRQESQKPSHPLRGLQTLPPHWEPLCAQGTLGAQSYLATL